MLYTVYKTTNKLNGKIYIGVHKTKNLDDGYLGSGLHLGYAIKKYGVDNFEKEILAVFDNKKDMFDMESELVNEDFIEDKSTYNLKLGGFGGFDHINDGSLKHITSATKGGKAAAYKEAIKKQKWLNEHDLEWKNAKQKKISESIKKYYADGGIGSFSGRKHTEESKRKIGMATSKTQKGIGNSQYGTIWISNITLKENKKIKNTDLIPEGWVKGRSVWVQHKQQKNEEIKQQKNEEIKQQTEFYWDMFVNSIYTTILEFYNNVQYPYSRITMISRFKRFIPEYSMRFKQGRKNH